MRLICDINLFDMIQNIYLEYGANHDVTLAKTVNLTDLPEALAIMYNDINNNIDSITLCGSLDYALGISDAIKAYSVSHYQNNDIKIEVIEL